MSGDATHEVRIAIVHFPPDQILSPVVPRGGQGSYARRIRAREFQARSIMVVGREPHGCVKAHQPPSRCNISDRVRQLKRLSVLSSRDLAPQLRWRVEHRSLEAQRLEYFSFCNLIEPLAGYALQHEAQQNIV